MALVEPEIALQRLHALWAPLWQACAATAPDKKEDEEEKQKAKQEQEEQREEESALRADAQGLAQVDYVLDLRSAERYRAAHLVAASSLPWREFDFRAHELPPRGAVLGVVMPAVVAGSREAAAEEAARARADGDHRDAEGRHCTATSVVRRLDAEACGGKRKSGGEV